MNNLVLSLAVGANGSLYAAGGFTTAGGVAANRVARWDGTAWAPLGSGIGGNPDVTLVTSLASGPDGSLYAGGGFTTAGGVPARNVARWDGTAWAPLGDGLGGPAYTLAYGLDGTLYAGGDFATAGSAPARNVARWDGTAWAPLGSGTDGAVLALAVGADGFLYAGGDFATAGGTTARHVARWDGTTWAEVGGGTDAPVRSLALVPAGAYRAGHLLAGGDFATAGRTAASRIARWDGTAWSGIASDVSGPSVFALRAASTGFVVFGGDFAGAGGASSPFVAAAYIGQTVSGAPEPVEDALALSVGPNPTRGAATAFITTEVPATVEVFDALGRRVGRAEGPAGERVAVALPTAGVAPGLYVVRLVAGDRVRTARLVVTR